jgi:hypothetical protein
MPERHFNDDRWYLCGGISGGIGRSWIIVAYGLSHVDPGEPLYMAAPTLAAAKSWLRKTLGVPIHYDQHSRRGYHVYCLDKYIEQVPTYDAETETYSDDAS